MMKKIRTGVPGFDVLTTGGLPAGRSTLVVGRSGTGKTVLGLQIAAHLCRTGTRTIVVGIEESKEDLIATGDTLGFNLSGLTTQGLLHVADMMRALDEPTIISGEYDVMGLVHRLEHLVAQTGAQAIVLDSATALFTPRPPQDLLRSHFFQLVHCFRRLGLTAIILAEAPSDYAQLTTLGVEDYVCDMVVIMRLNVDGERRRRTIEVAKYRRSGHYKGEFPCTITTRGLAIFPLDAPDRPESERIERYSSGVAGLDEMTNGGFLRNSIMLVRGPTGSGKTMLAGLFARAGALRSERVVYYGFEEPRPTLIRNFDQIGLGIGELVRGGDLKIQCRYPEATSLEDLLVDLRLGLEEFQPSLVVMDSISSIEHASSEKGFRQFMIGVASILRGHGRSALLTQTVLAGTAAEHTAPYLSTIADAIISLDYSPAGYELNRTMRVVKMRGSAHETHPYRLEFGAGGLKIERWSSDGYENAVRAEDRWKDARS
ncbi:MAG TPA: circadian clock protein KaiC [Vicinamibacterales bacterium]|nr:circadian clock protein KaiC [Vicinamibacterales bacterium]